MNSYIQYKQVCILFANNFRKKTECHNTQGSVSKIHAIAYLISKINVFY